MYGYTYVYTFVDSEGHQFIWKTGCYLDESEGSTLTVRCTIKAHSEYRGRGKLNSLAARQLRADFLEQFPANVSGGR